MWPVASVPNIVRLYAKIQVEMSRVEWLVVYTVLGSLRKKYKWESTN